LKQNHLLMKSTNKPFISLVTYLFICLLSGGCTTRTSISYDVKVPPKILIPSELVNFGLINRSIPNQEAKKADKIDQILSQEGFKIDERASILEMSNQLKQKNISTLEIEDSLVKKNTSLNKSPMSLTWQEVRDLCTKYKVDGLIVLEFFDTESSFSASSTPTTVNIPIGGTTLPANNYTVSVNTKIYSFWRIYDPIRKTILDEVNLDNWVNSSGTGLSIFAAYNAIKDRENDVMNASKHNVTAYTNDLFGRIKRTTESVYTSGSLPLKTASRMVQTRNIEGAMKEWGKDLSHPSAKVAGRAYYNLAVGYDYLGKPDTALTFAQKSYENYKIKSGMYFAKKLNSRKQAIVRY
jgi:Family of unknown function (DUF6340)